MQDSLVANNTIIKAGSTGILLQGGYSHKPRITQNISVIGNKIKDSGFDGIRLAGNTRSLEHIKIIENVIRGSQNYGIAEEGPYVSGNYILSNRFEAGNSGDLAVYNATAQKNVTLQKSSRASLTRRRTTCGGTSVAYYLRLCHYTRARVLNPAKYRGDGGKVLWLSIYLLW